MNDVLEYAAKNKAMASMISLVIFVLLSVGLYQLTAIKTTLLISEKATVATVGGKQYAVDGNKLTLSLRRKDYQIKVEKPGFETFYKVINPSESTTVKVSLKVGLSDKLTAALPSSLNQAGMTYKVRLPTYLEGGNWAVAEVVQFEIDSTDLPETFAVFKKVGSRWKLVAGPASEFLEEQGVEKLMPKNVYNYLEKQL